VILWMSLFGETFHAYPRLMRWTFPQFIEREIELVTMAYSCLSGPHISQSFDRSSFDRRRIVAPDKAE